MASPLLATPAFATTPLTAPAARPPRPVHARTGRVLLLDEGWAPTLYVADALEAGGFTAEILTAGTSPHPFRSGVMPQCGTAEYLDVVDALCRSGRFEHVLPLTEPIFYQIWDVGPGWEELVYPRTEPWQRHLFRDKTRMSAFVAERGVRVPAERHPRNADEALEDARAIGYPVVVKGTTGRAGENVRVAHTETELLHWFARISQRAGTPVLQEWIDGPAFLVGGVFHEGRPVRIYAAEKTVVVAPPTGPSIRHRTTTDPALLDAALTVFRALRWTGLAQSDWGRGADGAYRFFEVNPRPWGSLSAAVAAGSDMLPAFAAMLRGDAPEPDLVSADGVDVTVFPQYLLACIQGKHADGGLRSLLLHPDVWRAAPWTRPRLMRRLARHAYENGLQQELQRWSIRRIAERVARTVGLDRAEGA